jgi:hypothetical protein
MSLVARPDGVGIAQIVLLARLVLNGESARIDRSAVGEVFDSANRRS